MSPAITSTARLAEQLGFEALHAPAAPWAGRLGLHMKCRYRLALMGLARPANPLGIAQRGAPERRLGVAPLTRQTLADAALI